MHIARCTHIIPPPHVPMCMYIPTISTYPRTQRTNCVYDTVFGPGSNHTAYPSNATSGMDASSVIAAWLRPFESTDPSKGGCPDLNQ